MDKPLAIKLRPNSLKEVIGQKHLIGKDKVLTNFVKNKKLFSMILYGPPGLGKTSIANALVNDLGIRYRMLNAVSSNKKDFDVVVEEARFYDGIVLIMDEIHRLNKDKQDLLLPNIESGLITLIGMTTSNPYHAINPAIRSRCQLFELKPLDKKEIKEGIQRAIQSEYLKNIQIDEEAIEYIASVSASDLRYAYNLLEVAYYSFNKKITLEQIKSINNTTNFFHDKNEDGYYEVLSAFQKSIRGSDVNASLHYLARLLEAGDLESLFRRMSVIAYEDISLANPAIGPRVDSAIRLSERVGMPEARIILANVVIEMALSPKSNSAVVAIDKALEDIRTGKCGRVPKHIVNHNPEYKYPHNYKGHYVKQQYLPDNIKNKKYYIPNDIGYEINIKNIYERIEKLKKDL